MDRIIEVSFWDGGKRTMKESSFWKFASGRDSQRIMMAKVKDKNEYLKDVDLNE